MVKVLNLYEAKTQLSALVERAAAGEEMNVLLDTYAVLWWHGGGRLAVLELRP
jgi:hypothetical protein